MKPAKTRHLHEIRDAMIELMKDGRRFKQGELTRELIKDPYFDKNFCCDLLYGMVGLVVRTYDREFYRDPSDRTISLTLTELENQRRKAASAIRPGSTAAGRIHDALEAAEA